MIKKIKAGFFGDKGWAHIALEKIMKDQTNTDTTNNNIKKTKADLYESFYDGE